MEQIFLQVLSRSLEASVVVMAVIAMRLVFRSAPKWTHCLMWALVAVKLACPFAIESEFSLMPTGHSLPRLLNEAGWETGGGGQISDSADAVGQENPPPSAVSPAVGNGADSADHAAVSSDEEEPRAARESSRVPNQPLSAAGMAASVWLTGAAALLLYGAGSYLRLRRRLADAVPVEGTTLPIYRSDRIQTAFLCGVVKPKIYFPFGMSGETERQVIAHEAAHLQRRDHLTKAFAFVLAAVYWFNPVIWLAYVLYARDMELACDEKVVRGRSEEERKAYSRALLACAEENSAFLIHNAVPVGFGEIAVKKRVANVLKNKKNAVWVIVAALVVAAAVAVVLLTRPKSYAVDVPQKLDDAIAENIFDSMQVSMSDFLMDDERYYYAAVSGLTERTDCECAGEGHLVLGMQESDHAVTVYALCSASGYGFRDGNLVSNTGYSCVPTVITFAVDDDGHYRYQSRQEPEDGAYFRKSVEKMFPRSVLAQYDKSMKTAGSHNEVAKQLSDQCDKYAEGYLKKIGREAKIGDYADFDFKILSDYGVSPEVSNALYELHTEDGIYIGNYGIYLGNFETIENGTRYVYAQIWNGDNRGNGIVTFMKYVYATGEEWEKVSFKVEGDTFTEIKSKGQNQS